MELNNKQRCLFREALLKAFINLNEFELFLEDTFDLRLENIVPIQGLTNVMIYRNVINVFQARGNLDKLVFQALDYSPNNMALQKFAQTLELLPIQETEDELERIVQQNSRFINVGEFLSKVGETQHKLCRIEYNTDRGTTYATGFLIGPDLVMTNNHVVKPVIDGTVSAAEVKLLFDYILDADGVQIRDVTTTKLTIDNWLVDSSPISDCDKSPASENCLPNSNELDYALIRIQDSLGSLPIGINKQAVGAKVRGWVDLSSSKVPVCEPVILLQHPVARPLKMTFGNITEVNSNHTRVRYNANTEPGSSGAAVFDLDWQIVALHHAGDPNFSQLHRPEYNQGIPTVAIFDLLSQRGFGDHLSDVN